eukprot:GDKJ01048633.1.p1 GENE.GDKJ01048633.1~~GDKJ01048633.1.p1  ORF type:complete len:1021 (+),score=341.12 GDKJ01048633.1:25-3063(+)
MGNATTLCSHSEPLNSWEGLVWASALRARPLRPSEKNVGNSMYDVDAIKIDPRGKITAAAFAEKEKDARKATHSNQLTTAGTLMEDYPEESKSHKSDFESRARQSAQNASARGSTASFDGEMGTNVRVSIRKTGEEILAFNIDVDVLKWCISADAESTSKYTVSDEGIYIFDLPVTLENEADEPYGLTVCQKAVEGIVKAMYFVAKHADRVEHVQGVPSAVIGLYPPVDSNSPHTSQESLKVSTAARDILNFFQIREHFRVNVFDMYNTNVHQVSFTVNCPTVFDPETNKELSGDVTYEMTPIVGNDARFMFSHLLWFDGFKGFGPRLSPQNLAVERSEVDQVLNFKDDVIKRITSNEFADSNALINYLIDLGKRYPDLMRESPTYKSRKELKAMYDKKDSIVAKVNADVAKSIAEYTTKINAKFQEYKKARETAVAVADATEPIPRVVTEQEWQKLEQVVKAAVVKYGRADKTSAYKSSIPTAQLDAVKQEFLAIVTRDFEKTFGNFEVKWYKTVDYQSKDKKNITLYYPVTENDKEIEKQVKELKKQSNPVQAPVPQDGLIVQSNSKVIDQKTGYRLLSNGQKDLDRTAVLFNTLKNKTYKASTVAPDSGNKAVKDAATKCAEIETEVLFTLMVEKAVAETYKNNTIAEQTTSINKDIAKLEAKLAKCPKDNYVTAFASNNSAVALDLRSEALKAILLCLGSEDLLEQLFLYLGHLAPNEKEGVSSVVDQVFSKFSTHEAAQVMLQLVDKYPITHFGRFQEVVSILNKKIMSDPYVFQSDEIRRSSHPTITLFRAALAADVHYGNLLFPFDQLAEIPLAVETLSTLENKAIVKAFSKVLSSQQINMLARHKFNQEYFKLSEYVSSLTSPSFFKYLIHRIPFLYLRNKLTAGQIETLATTRAMYTRLATPVKVLMTEADKLPFVVDLQNKKGPWMFNMDELAAVSVYKDQAYLIVRFLEGKIESAVPEEMLHMIINSKPSNTLQTALNYDVEDETKDSPLRAVRTIADEAH